MELVMGHRSGLGWNCGKGDIADIKQLGNQFHTPQLNLLKTLEPIPQLLKLTDREGEPIA